MSSSVSRVFNVLSIYRARLKDACYCAIDKTTTLAPTEDEPTPLYVITTLCCHTAVTSVSPASHEITCPRCIKALQQLTKKGSHGKDNVEEEGCSR